MFGGVERRSEQKRRRSKRRWDDTDRSGKRKFSFKEKSEELVNALKANGDDIRSCRDAKASISSLIGTLRRAIERVRQLLSRKRETEENGRRGQVRFGCGDLYGSCK